MKERSKEDGLKCLCMDLSNTDVLRQVQIARHQGNRVTSRVLWSFIQLRKAFRKLTEAGDGGHKRRNCDVMTTATALRKGWERRCEHGTPCCPFEYAMEPFDGEGGE